METNKARLTEARATAQMLACIYKQLLEINASNGYVATDPSRITHFFTLVPPIIGLPEYLNRISQHASCSNECYILSLIYVNKLIVAHDLALTRNNVHRVILISIMLAAKFQDDRYYDNQYYARLGGITLKELNLLEAEFLYGINFELFVAEKEFKMYENHLMEHAYSSLCTCGCYPELRIESTLPSFDLGEMYLGSSEPSATSLFEFSIDKTEILPAFDVVENFLRPSIMDNEPNINETESLYWKFDYLG